MKSIYLVLLTLLSSLVLFSCTTTKSSASKKQDKSEKLSVAYGETTRAETTGSVAKIEPDQPNLTLADYLRRVPGVSVRGSGDNVKVVIRGGITSSGSNEPLYVVNNVPSGNSYAIVASMVDVNDIKDINVIKDTSTASMYGVQAQHGVIMISTKRRN